MNPKVDAFLRGAKRWQKEMAALRQIPLACGLAEELKWGHPCYTFEGRNVVLIHGFKEYCGLLFFKGVLLKDPRKILVRQTENVQSARQARFTSVREVAGRAAALRAYVRQAIELEKSGAKVPHKKTSDYPVPEEFQKVMKQQPAARAAFQALTPGRQRGYLFYFSGAKQAKTRESRIAKHLPRILKGKGLDD
ncbi:MAG TPA: YdeI/OmpD-associated family protein [Opitutaceae bacterium]|nr:YdeI/OmpD-associated family protein [Opitutaceae bacterium]